MKEFARSAIAAGMVGAVFLGIVSGGQSSGQPPTADPKPAEKAPENGPTHPAPASPAGTPAVQKPDAGKAKPDGTKQSIPKPTKPEKPGLAVGTTAPDAAVRGEDGKEIKLASLWKDGPVVITFYRGGWCPFCNRALEAWRDKVADLKAAGARLVAISPETHEHVAKTHAKAKTDYLALCDHKQEAAKAFKVIFEMDEPTQVKYRGFGIDLSKHNASGTWNLPAPAIFVIDTSGTIRWVHADWDYKKRADPDDVIKAVKALK